MVYSYLAITTDAKPLYIFIPFDTHTACDKRMNLIDFQGQR